MMANFFFCLLGLRCEGEMAMRIAEKLVGITDAKIPFVFKGSFKKNKSL
jgi:3-deoxy-D-manno-octulosonic acid (KDO) 8-phosphate synthase